MTDKELRDAAVAELELTTAGWRKSNGNPNYPSGTAPLTTHWGKAMDFLRQIGAVAPTPPPPPPPPPPPDPGGYSPERYVYTLGSPTWNPTGTPGWWNNQVTSAGWGRGGRVYFAPTVTVMQSVSGDYGNNAAGSGPCHTIAVQVNPEDPIGGANPNQAASLNPYYDLYTNPYFGPPPNAKPQPGETWYYGFAMRTNPEYIAHGQITPDLTWGMFNTFGLEFHVRPGFGPNGPIKPEIHTIRPANINAGPNGGVWWTCNSPGSFSHLSPPRLGIALTAGVNNTTVDDATHTCRRFQGPIFEAGRLYKMYYKVKWDANQQGTFDWWIDSGAGPVQYASQTGVSTLWRDSAGNADTDTYPTFLNYRKADTTIPNSIMYYGGFIRGKTMADVLI